MFRERGLHLKGSVNHFKVPTCFSTGALVVPVSSTPSRPSHSHTLRCEITILHEGCRVRGFLPDRCLIPLPVRECANATRPALSAALSLISPSLSIFFIDFFGGGDGGLLSILPSPHFSLIVLSLHQSYPDFGRRGLPIVFSQSLDPDAGWALCGPVLRSQGILVSRTSGPVRPILQPAT